MGTRARPATRSISKTPLTPPSRWLVSASCQLDRNRLGYRLVHRVGNEAAWWKDAGIDPAKAARKLWNDSRVDQGRIALGPTAQRPSADRTANSEGQAADSPTAA